MEEVVFNLIEDVLKNVDVCKCEKCKMDIAAIVLNNLPPKYVVTEQGELYSKINILLNQFGVDVISEITKAAILVSNNPHHQVVDF
jgi:competence protein ComFB